MEEDKQFEFRIVCYIAVLAKDLLEAESKINESLCQIDWYKKDYEVEFIN